MAVGPQIIPPNFTLPPDLVWAVVVVIGLYFGVKWLKRVWDTGGGWS